MLKALIDKLIQCRHKTIYLQHLVCILPKCSSSNMSRDALLLRFCIVLHTLETTCVMCVSVTFLLLRSFALLFASCEALWLFTLCCSHSASLLSHIFTSFSHLVDDSLVFESCVFCSMICSVVSLLLPGLSLFFLLLLLHPGSQPNLTYVSASDVLINNCTMLTIMLNSSRPLLVTPRDPFECSHPTSLSRSHFMPSSPWQDFLGQVFCTLGEIVGSPASRLEKPLGWVEISQCSICRVVWQEWQALSVF